MGLDWELDEPCEKVGAPKLKDVLSHKELIERLKNSRMSAEEILEEYSCEHCPAMEEMDPGATGIISSPCSFRGKMVSRYMPELPGELKSRAYADMDPQEMLEYADELSKYIDVVERRGTLEQAIQWLRYWAGKGVSMVACY